MYKSVCEFDIRRTVILTLAGNLCNIREKLAVCEVEISVGTGGQPGWTCLIDHTSHNANHRYWMADSQDYHVPPKPAQTKVGTSIHQTGHSYPAIGHGVVFYHRQMIKKSTITVIRYTP